MDAGTDCEVMLATNGGARWVAGTVERFRPVAEGDMRVDVMVNGTLHRNCWLGSVRLPREAMRVAV